MAAEYSAAPSTVAECTLEVQSPAASNEEAESKELTVVELVRLRWQENARQDATVEDVDAFSDHSVQQLPAQPAADHRPASFVTQEPASPHSGLAAPSPKLPTRRRAPRRLGASASAPTLGGADKVGASEKLEHTRLPVVEPRSRCRAVSEGPVCFERLQRSQARRVSLLQDDLRKLPDSEALRQILIERAGTLKQAYKAMDVNGTGDASPSEFEEGLRRAGIFGSPLVGYRDAADLFRGIDKAQNGVLSLQEFLGYVPMKPTRTRDTRALWNNYSNKTSAQKSRLARKPRWKPDRILPDHETERVRQRRELKHQLVDARKRGCLKMEEKRRLVRGLVSDEERDRDRHLEYQKMNKQHERIGDAIHSCAQARSELVALQQAMVQLSPETHRRTKFAHHHMGPLNFQRKATGKASLVSILSMDQPLLLSAP